MKTKWRTCTIDARRMLNQPRSKYPPAEPGALGREPLKAAGGAARAAPQIHGSQLLRQPSPWISAQPEVFFDTSLRFESFTTPSFTSVDPKISACRNHVLQRSALPAPSRHSRNCQTSTASPAEPGGLSFLLAKKSADSLEYVVMHELVHQLAKHHDDRFVAIMDKHLPR
jgi:hypothetical protein